LFRRNNEIAEENRGGGLSLLLSVSLIPIVASGSAAATNSGHSFSDVTANTRFHSEINWLGGQNIAQGYRDEHGENVDVFRPNHCISRVTAAVFLHRAAGSPAVSGANLPIMAESEHWTGDALHAANWVLGNHLTSSSDGDYDWYACTTRAEFARWLYFSAGSPAVTGTSRQFTDVNSNNASYDAIQWASQQNIFRFWHQFGPNATVTRGLAAALMYRAHSLADAWPNLD
jgi:hypothetical protein